MPQTSDLLHVQNAKMDLNPEKILPTVNPVPWQPTQLQITQNALDVLRILSLSALEICFWKIVCVMLDIMDIPSMVKSASNVRLILEYHA
jgi:hypothetical protein